MHVRQICDRIVAECEHTLATNVGSAPRHLHEQDEPDDEALEQELPQKELF